MAESTTKISELMDAQVLAITSTTTAEEAVEIFDKYDRSALPIITENGVLVGIVTFDDILDKVQEQTTEEIHKFGVQEDWIYLTPTPRYWIWSKNELDG